MSSGISRRGLLSAFAATAVSATPVHAGIFGFLKGAGDYRRLRMYNPRTGESLDTIYWIEGDYIRPALDEINWFMRDWRRDAVIEIDTRTIDIATASHRLLEADEPFTLYSGYRTQKTNNMLRRRSNGGVARNSLHVKGQANDLHLASRSVDQIYRAARALSAGGVGKYSRSDFVHLDCGGVRSWGS